MRPALRNALAAASAELVGCAFEGFYAERVLRASSGASEYDALVVLADWERGLSERLGNALDRFAAADPSVVVSCERSPSARLRLDLDEALPFGCYWLRIGDVRLEREEVRFDVVVLRHLPEREQREERTFDKTETETPSFDFRVDPAAVGHALKVALVAATAAFAGAFKLVMFLGDFTIRFTRELAVLIEKSQPTVRMLLDFCGRFFSATFALIALLVRGNKPIAVTDARAIDYDRRAARRNRAYDYDERASPGSYAYDRRHFD